MIELFYLLSGLLFLPTVLAVLPRSLTWSSKTYGPDGPWQAVSVAIGTPPQKLDLFPGGYYSSRIFGSSLCNTACDAQNAGVFNPQSSSTVATSFATGPGTNNISFYYNTNIFGINSSLYYDTLKVVPDAPDTPTVPLFALEVMTAGFNVLPSGKKYSLQVGGLALGAQDPNQTFPRAGLPNWNGTALPSSLFEQGLVPSNSYGLHIGSATMKIPGSLYIGGYDQTRVLGPVSVQPYAFNWLPIDMLDIEIGTAVGNSPFNFTSKSGLLREGNATIGSHLEVHVDSEVPYLYLPQSTCDTIASNLPVTFRKDLGLYLWNTTHPQYQAIISSPAYLGFSFRQNGSSTERITINVPFCLLNLTLASPIVDIPVQYFPCRPMLDPAPAFFSLGRAFLQAAFVGVAWQTNRTGGWFLAQAPGPNTPTAAGAVVNSIQPSDRFIVPSNRSWFDSWNSTWTPVGNNVINPNGTASTPTHLTELGPKTKIFGVRDIVGVVIGGLLGFFLLAGIVIFCLRKRRDRKNASTKIETSLIEQDMETPPGKGYYSGSVSFTRDGGYGPREMDAAHGNAYIPSTGPPKELNAETRPSEMEGSRRHPSEMPG
ncbi:aspartic peptidase domain-containing protein [Tricladium varicosporioides]|nr:aspartic peptidase domain-containing protein [Hymenoscyphus varicosporioides]